MATALDERAWTHPALTLAPSLTSDVFPELFEWFFTHPVFVRWREEGIDWQLHCVGGPGTGKTTLATAVASHLESYFRPYSLPVVHVLVQDVTIHELDFLEDFLVAFYQGLGKWGVYEDAGAENDGDEYVWFRFDKDEGSRFQHRLSLLRKAIYSRLQSLKEKSHAFLIVDGIDCCSASLRLMLDAELFELQKRRVKVLITSRNAIYEHRETTCDHVNHIEGPVEDHTHQDDTIKEDDSIKEHNTSDEDDTSEEDDNSDEVSVDSTTRTRLDLFLKCRTCKNVLCFPCHSAGNICGKCQTNDALYEDYDHVSIHVGTTDDAMKNFIAWSLEREHGDLGLGSSARKPPLSTLGLSFRNDHPGRALAVVDEIQDRADGHIGLAKARLDLVHDAQSVEEVLQYRYQLPSNIVTMYEAAVKAVEAQSPDQRELGLKAIAAAGRNLEGMAISRMQELLNNSITMKARSGEDIVHAAKGFLFVTPFDVPQVIAIFHVTFYRFVEQRYNESLHRANLELKRDNTRKKTFSYHEAPVVEKSRVRFEPLNLSEEPAEITPDKLKRTVTSMQMVEEAPSRAYVLRKGTRVWH